MVKPVNKPFFTKCGFPPLEKVFRFAASFIKSKLALYIKYNKSFLTGFTLLEILIAISIVTTLSVIGMTSYSSFNQSKTLDVETAEFGQILEMAKKRAFSNDKVSCTVLSRYAVTIDANNIDYNLTVICDDESVAQTLNYKLDSAVVFNQYQTAATSFTPNSSGATGNCIIIKHSKSDQCKQVSVNSLGLIEIEDSGDCSC